MISPIVDEFLLQTISRAVYILRQPFTNEEVIWILAPLIAALILMEIYFGRYKDEELGWNTAFGNSLILVFISANLIHFVIRNHLITDPVRSGVVIVLILVGIILTIIDYFHALPEDWAFALSSRFPMSFIAFLAILFVYSEIPLDQITLGAFIFIFIVAYVLVTIIHYTTPAVRSLLPRDVPDPTLS